MPSTCQAQHKTWDTKGEARHSPFPGGQQRPVLMELQKKDKLFILNGYSWGYQN